MSSNWLVVDMIIMLFSHEHCIGYNGAIYRIMTFPLTITDPCFLAFYTTIAFKSYISNFLIENVFIYLFSILLGGYFSVLVSSTVLKPWYIYRLHLNHLFVKVPYMHEMFSM